MAIPIFDGVIPDFKVEVYTPPEDFILESGAFAFTGSDISFAITEVLECESGNFAYDLREAFIEWTTVTDKQLASKPIWHEGNYPPFEHVAGALPNDAPPPHWGDSAPPPMKLVNNGLLGNIIRNDNPGIPKRVIPGIVAESPLLYFFGCDVTPKEIVLNEVLVGDYFVPIQISNNHLGKSIEIRALYIKDDPFNTVTITPYNWPRMLKPYSVETYSLKISGTEGYPKIDLVLVVDAGTCYTEIPITGAREVDCPQCPDIPIIGDFNMACAIEQDLCNVSRGDTMPFTFGFTNPDKSEMDIQGMRLTFEMRLDSKSVDPDLSEEVVFGADAETALGRGSMKILPSKTTMLIAGMKYCYKFIFEQSSTDIYTVGRGAITVNPDAQKR